MSASEKCNRKQPLTEGESPHALHVCGPGVILRGVRDPNSTTCWKTNGGLVYVMLGWDGQHT